MLKVQCDKNGRIYLKRRLRARYGEKFIVLETARDIVLLPVPRDPVRALQEIGKPLRGYSIAQIKAMIREQAEKEALGNLHRKGET